MSTGSAVNMKYAIHVENFEIGESSDTKSSYRYLLRWRGEFISSHETLAKALRALADELEKWDL